MSAFRLSSDLPSYSIVPRMGPSVPRTVDTIMCFTLKPAAEWAVSTVHVVGPAGWARTDIERAATAATARNALRMQIYSSRKTTGYEPKTPPAARAFQRSNTLPATALVPPAYGC